MKSITSHDLMQLLPDRDAPCALPYASKVTGLLEDLEMDTPPLGSIGIGQLTATIDRSWDTRAEIRAKINRRLSGLKTRAKQTNDLLIGLLGGSSIAPIARDSKEPAIQH